MSRFLAARDFLHPAGRPDVCLALEDADKTHAPPSWLVRRTFVCLSLWPFLVECHDLALRRARFDAAFHGELLDTLEDLLHLSDAPSDPMPAIIGLAGEMTAYAWHLVEVGGAPLDIAKACVAGYGWVFGEPGWMRVEWHPGIDPDGHLAEAGHRELRHPARRLLANRDFPAGRQDRIAAVAGAVVDLVALKRMRDAA